MPADRATQAQLISQLKYAIEQERLAYRRYNECTRLTDNAKVMELLLFLAKEEQAHEEKLQRLLAELQPVADKPQKTGPK